MNQKEIKEEVARACKRDGHLEVSHATLRTEDLLLFIQPFTKGTYLFDEIEKIKKDGSWDSEEAIILLNEDVMDYMDSLSPEGFYFGSHFGDGSAIGFWQYEELPEE